MNKNTKYTGAYPGFYKGTLELVKTAKQEGKGKMDYLHVIRVGGNTLLCYF